MKVYGLCDDRCEHLWEEIDRRCRAFSEIESGKALVVFPCGEPPEVVEVQLSDEVYAEVLKLSPDAVTWRLLRYIWELLPDGAELAKAHFGRELN